jgi:threonine/homoserine/homoserine lactone efflux protein
MTNDSRGRTLRAMSSLLLGFGLGFVVAAAIGPISLLCIRSVLRGRLAVGIAIGAGAAVVDATYAALGIVGVGSLLTIDALRVTLGLLGALVLAAMGARTLWSAFRVRLGGEAADEIATPRKAFLTSLAATLSNPTTIASWAAVFAAASAATDITSPGAAALLVLGVGMGTMTWFTILSTGLSALRSRVGDRLLEAIDFGSGLGILAFAGVLGWRSAADAA